MGCWGRAKGNGFLTMDVDTPLVFRGVCMSKKQIYSKASDVTADEGVVYLDGLTELT